MYLEAVEEGTEVILVDHNEFYNINCRLWNLLIYNLQFHSNYFIILKNMLKYIWREK
jgi:hypothetical protein